MEGMDDIIFLFKASTYILILYPQREMNVWKMVHNRTKNTTFTSFLQQINVNIQICNLL